MKKHLYITPKGVIFATSLAHAANIAEKKHIHEVKLLETECPIYFGRRIFKATIVSNNGQENESFSTYVVGQSKESVLWAIKHSDLIDCSTINVIVEATQYKLL